MEFHLEENVSSTGSWINSHGLFCSQLDALVVVEINIIVNEPSGLLKRRDPRPADIFCFKDRKKFSVNALAYGFPRLDIDGVMPYS